MKSPLVPASPYVQCESGGCVFGFTLRVAQGVEVGLDVTHNGGSLHVTGVKPDGAIAAWNRQCHGGPVAGKEVKVGDKIVAVNNTSEAELMLLECRTKHMLKLTVVRGEPDCAIPAGWIGQADMTKIEKGALSQQMQLMPPPPVSQAAMAAMMAALGGASALLPPTRAQVSPLKPCILKDVPSKLRANATEFFPMAQ